MSVIFHAFCEGCGVEVIPTVNTSFLCNGCDTKDPKALREGFVSMEEILNGQHVTGEQFFAAYRDAIGYEEEVIGNNPKSMSYKTLCNAYEEACEDRIHLYRKLKRDEELLDAMDDWVKKLYEELRKR
jgi:hypothetical protein